MIPEEAFTVKLRIQYTIKYNTYPHITHISTQDWIGLCSVLRPLQHSIGYMGDGFYRSKDPTNSIKVLKDATKENNTKNKENTKFTCIDTQKVDKYSIQV